MIIIKKCRQCKAGIEGEHSHHTTNAWKGEKEKIVGNKRKSRLGQQEGIASAQKPASPTRSLRWFHRDIEKGTKVPRY